MLITKTSETRDSRTFQEIEFLSDVLTMKFYAPKEKTGKHEDARRQRTFERVSLEIGKRKRVAATVLHLAFLI